MTQVRYFDFLADHSQISLSKYMLDVLPIGIYSGCDLILSATDVRMTSGKYMASSGVLVEETSEIVLGPLPSTSPGIPLSRTVVGFGPSNTTVQRTAFTYTISVGLLSEDDFLTDDRQHIIIGWLKFDGAVWRFVNANKQQPAPPIPASKKLGLPIPGIAYDEILNFGGAGPSMRTNLTGVWQSVVPLNNEYPITSLIFSMNGVIGTIPITVSIENIDYVGSPISVGTIPANTSPFTIQMDVLTPNLTNAMLKLSANGVGDIYWKSIEILQEPGYI